MRKKLPPRSVQFMGMLKESPDLVLAEVRMMLAGLFDAPYSDSEVIRWLKRARGARGICVAFSSAAGVAQWGHRPTDY